MNPFPSPPLRPKCKLIHVLLVVLAFFFLFPERAHAYIDPGSGALLLQALVAGLFGAAFFLRDSLKKVFRWIRARLGGKSLAEGKPPPGGGDGDAPPPTNAADE